MNWLGKTFSKLRANWVKKDSAVTAHSRRCILQIEQMEERLMPSVAHPDLIIHHSPGATPYTSAPYTPSDIRSAYGINKITFAGGLTGDGSGQTIAIIDAYNSPTIVSDLATFDSRFGLSAPPRFQVVNQYGGASLPGADPAGKGSWDLEAALDVEWTHAIAPKANIILFEANSASYSDLLAAVNTARYTAGVSVVSMSFVSDEFSSETSYDAYFTTPGGHNGVTFVASTGDNGSPGGFAAASRNVVAVGGTSLSLNGSSYGSETGWSGSGGGVSQFESRPTYQNSVITVVGVSRGTPDVSFNADPNTGVWVEDSYAGGWFQVGGTSFAAPAWGALIAIADQGRAAAGLGTLDGATQTLPTLYSVARRDFHDVTSGSNGAYSASAGYDLVTGLGSPVANLLIPDLAGVKSGGGGTVSNTTSYSVADFSGQGVYRYSDATGWQRLTPADATSVGVDDFGNVVGAFAGQGVYRYEAATGWRQLTWASASSVAIAGNGIVVADLPGYGLFRFEDAVGWQQLTRPGATSIGVDANGDVVAAYAGEGVYRFEDATGWQHLTWVNASQVAIAGNGVVAAQLAGYGVYRFEDGIGWQQLTGAVSSSLSVNSRGDVACQFNGYGVYRFEDSTGWQTLTTLAASQVAIAGNGDVLTEFAGYGVYRYKDVSGWQGLNSANASFISMNG